MRVSIVIATLGRAQVLDVTLDSLRFQRFSDFEVIVVNGPSSDDTDEVIRKYGGRIKAVDCPIANLSMARNMGIAQAAGDIIAFLDDDGVPEPDWLTYLVAPYADPKVGGVGGFIRDHRGINFQAMVTVCDTAGGNRAFSTVSEAEEWLKRHPDDFISLTGCNSSFRRSALVEIGGFDEEYEYFLDETDVCLRLTKGGYLLSVSSLAQVHHKYAPSHLRDHRRVPKSLLAISRSAIYFAARHMRPDQPWAFERLKRRFRADRDRDISRNLRDRLIDADQAAALRSDVGQGMVEALQDISTHPAGRMRRPAELNGPPPFLPYKEAKQALRVCLVSQDYMAANPGGIGVWTHTVAEGMARRGHEVTVIAQTEDDSYVDFVQGVWVHGVRAVPSSARRFPPLPDLPDEAKARCYAVYDELCRVTSLRGLDVISFPIWDLEGLACIASPVPAVMSLHTTYALALPFKSHWQADDLYRRGYVEKMIDAERWALSHAPALLANSQAIVRDLEVAYSLEQLSSKAELIPHGVQDYASQYRPRGSGRTRVLFVGRFERRKGIDLLLSVIPDLAERFPDVDWIVVGNHDILDGDVNHHQDFVARHGDAKWMGRVFFRGELDREALLREFADCDLFVAPSRYESFGLIFAEAASLGKAAVGLSVGGVPEVVLNGTTGVLVDDTPADLRDAIAGLLENPGMREQLGRAARRRYEEVLSADSMLDQLECYLGRVSGRLGNHPCP